MLRENPNSIPNDLVPSLHGECQFSFPCYWLVSHLQPYVIHVENLLKERMALSADPLQHLTHYITDEIICFNAGWFPAFHDQGLKIYKKTVD
jgi:hypothetical protein